ncbi:MAG: hypothetical protein K0Q72_3635 [Armatimonadetes bacterium]|nr:hypothetical protein [Armatimonadota bacterium]
MLADPLPTADPTFLRALLDAVEAGLFVLDGDGHLSFVNRAAGEMLGYSPAELVGREPFFAPGADWTRGPAEARFRRGDGEDVEVEYAIHPVREDNPGAGVAVTLREVGERRRAERVARAQTAALVSTVRGLEQSASLDAYLGEVLKALMEQLNESSGALWLWDESSGELRLHLDYYDGEIKAGGDTGHPLAVQPPSDDSQAWERLPEPRVYDVETSPELESSRVYHRSRGTRAILVLPMRLGERTLGNFSVRSVRRNAFSSGEIELAKALVHQATLALQLTGLADQARNAAVALELERAAQERASALAETNRALQAEVEERRRAEEALRRSDAVLRQTVASLAEEPPLDTFLGHVLTSVTEQLSGPASTLWFYRPEENAFAIHMSYGDGGVHPGPLEANGTHGPTRLPADRADLMQLRRTRRPVVINNVARQPHLGPHLEWLKARGVRGLLLVPLVAGEHVIGVIGVHNTRRGRWTEEETRLAEALAAHASLAVQLTRYAAQARRAGTIEERNRLAQEIHDTLAQGFTGILVQLEAAQDALDKSPAEAREHVVIAGELARESLAEARRSVHALRPLALETDDLAGVVARMVQRLADLSGLKVTFECRGPRRPLPAEVADNLLRSSQEALANALRHAEASAIRVVLEYEADAVSLSVRDNGLGFDPAEARRARTGLGLSGLQERADRMRGELRLNSRPGGGSEVVLWVPVENE